MPQYLHYLRHELELHSRTFSAERSISGIVFDGANLALLSNYQIKELVQYTKRLFQVEETANLQVRVSPASSTKQAGKLDRSTLAGLCELGVSVFGFDFLPGETAQQESELDATISAFLQQVRQVKLRAASASVTLWPHRYRKLSTLSRVLQSLINMGVDCITCNYWEVGAGESHHSKTIAEQSFACLGRHLQIRHIVDDLLPPSGYRATGMNAFVSAEHSADLPFNNQCLMSGSDGLLGTGLGAITLLETICTKNHSSVAAYIDSLDDGLQPIALGKVFDLHDRICGGITHKLISGAALDLSTRLDRFSDSPDRRTLGQYLEDDAFDIKSLINDELLIKTEGGLQTTRRGRYFLPQIIAQFCRPRTITSEKVVRLKNDPSI
ncbi:MAG: hypothetical protein HKN50_13535 [Gammaproteobacteria bacterium]|nr:hypothetical protein [Gammaproteobacteria bacterium]